MRSSNDYFNQNYNNFNDLGNTFIPRPTVPLFPDRITSKAKAAQSDKVQYPIFNSSLPPAINSLETTQQKIDQEISKVQKPQPNLDQLIENALKQKITHDHQVAQPKVISIKKIAPILPQIRSASSPVKPREFYWPDRTPTIKKVEIPTISRKVPTFLTPISSPTAAPARPIIHDQTRDKTQKKSIWFQLLSSAKRVQQTPFFPTAKPKIIAPLSVKNAASTKLPINPITPRTSSGMEISANLLNYFLFIINPETDPYNDSNRHILIYAIKVLAYLILFAGIEEFGRNMSLDLNLNSTLEVISIFLISAILFFFGENINILSKPVNPYQIHEVV